MVKSQAKGGQNDDLRLAADTMIARANAIRTVPAKERARDLARMVLEGAPHFGGLQLKDADIQQALEAEGIGLATFRKALSEVRKERVKKPRSSPTKAVRASTAALAASPLTKPCPARTPRGNEPAFVENVPAELL